MTTTGERIREMRLRQRLTLDDVAKYLNVNRQAIYKYEHGIVTNIPLENLEKMAELFCTSPGYLAGWSDAAPSSASAVSSTPEARIISEGIDKMPKKRREQALRIMQVAFAEYSDYFKEDHADNI